MFRWVQTGPTTLRRGVARESLTLKVVRRETVSPTQVRDHLDNSVPPNRSPAPERSKSYLG